MLVLKYTTQDYSQVGALGQEATLSNQQTIDQTIDETVDQATLAKSGAAGGNTKHDPPPIANAFFHVNERKAKVDPGGEDLMGREILARTGLSADKYELWTVVHGKTGAEIGPDQKQRVKPGDHFRATIRGTDYSSPEARWTHGEAGR